MYMYTFRGSTKGNIWNKKKDIRKHELWFHFCIYLNSSYIFLNYFLKKYRLPVRIQWKEVKICFRFSNDDSVDFCYLDSQPDNVTKTLHCQVHFLRIIICIWICLTQFFIFFSCFLKMFWFSEDHMVKND
jgi:hypothetical protein